MLFQVIKFIVAVVVLVWGSWGELEEGEWESAQSLAARQRRRKIIEKNQELSKLIPGANKLTTAQMFHAAYNYVKFLQSQIAILQLIKEDFISHDDRLDVLLTSPAIQEKLSTEEKCLAPKESLEILAKDQEIQSSPNISKEIGLLVSSPTPSS